MMRNGLGKCQEIISVAGDHDVAMLCGMLQDCCVVGVYGQNRPEGYRLVPHRTKRVNEIVGRIMIEQEGHSSAGAICRATSTSISPR